MGIEVVPCKVEHIGMIERHESQAHQDGSGLSFEEEELRLLSRTIMLDDRPIACLGVSLLWDGVGQAWALLSEEAVTKYPIALSRIALKLVKEAYEIYPFKRLQIFADPDYEPAKKWAEFLGFEEEGVLHNYGGDDTNIRVMARWN